MALALRTSVFVEVRALHSLRASWNGCSGWPVTMLRDDMRVPAALSQARDVTVQAWSVREETPQGLENHNPANGRIGFLKTRRLSLFIVLCRGCL